MGRSKIVSIPMNVRCNSYPIRTNFYQILVQKTSVKICRLVALQCPSAYYSILVHITRIMQNLNFEGLTYPPYSLDLNPSEHGFFGLLKKALRFISIKSEKFVHYGLAAEPKIFFFEYIICTKIDQMS